MRIVAIISVVVFFLATSLVVSSESEAESISDSFSIKLTDSEGNDLSDPLFGDVVIFFDTYNTEYGTIYKLKAMLSIKTVPANILITSTGGLFKLAVAATGVEGSLVEETGLRFTLTNGEDTFNADLKKSNNYSTEFRNGANLATLDPNVNYSVSASLIEGYDSTVEPGDMKDAKITFQAIVADGMHQVMFISEDNTVESYMAFDNYVIEKVPTVSRGGYTFKGWFTPDGREIADGYVISPNEGDILAFAQWEKNDDSMILYLGIGGSSLAALLLLLLFLKRRKDDAES